MSQMTTIVRRLGWTTPLTTSYADFQARLMCNYIMLRHLLRCMGFSIFDNYRLKSSEGNSTGVINVDVRLLINLG